MTNETINLIIEWFDHIKQLATDRKTQTGAVMDAQHCLNEIAAIARESKQFVEEYRYEQEPIDEEELDKLTEKEMNLFLNVNTGEMHYCTVTEKEAFKAGYRKALER